MSVRTPSAPVLIACCGNPLAGDDALATLVAHGLRARGLPRGVELLDLGANPTELTDHLEGRAALVIVDAIACEGRPAGELLDTAWSEARPALALNLSSGASTHGLGLAEQLELAEQLGMLPPVVRLIGLTIAQAKVGCEPGESVRSRVPALVERVRTTAALLATAPPRARHARPGRS